MAQPNRKEKADRTREALLAAALNEFAAAGPDLANIDRISLQAGLGKGTIYNYFKSKKHLYQSILGHAATNHAQRLVGAIERESSPELKLRALFMEGFAFVTDSTSQANLLLNAVNSTNPEIRTFLGEFARPWLEALRTEILEAGINDGTFRQADPRPLVHLVASLYLGAASQRKQDGVPFLPAASTAEFALAALRP